MTAKKPTAGSGDRARVRSRLRRIAAMLGKKLRQPFRNISFVGSERYWEGRYAAGGNAGSGSLGRLAAHKALFLGNLLARLDVGQIAEFGCGDGHQLAHSSYRAYTGYDISPTALQLASKRLADRSHYRFCHMNEWTPEDRYDLTMSLDVIYHLVEDAAFDAYMARLFDAACIFVVIYSSNESMVSKDPHVRHRRFSDWVARHRPMFESVLHEPNPYPFDQSDPENTSLAEFHVFRRRDANAGPRQSEPTGY
jgi:SAM-dependent methyltransferase